VSVQIPLRKDGYLLMRNSKPYQHTVIEDMWLGAIHGDFAPEMGGGGRLTQAILGFVPIIGTLCAIRDCIADLIQRDLVGAVLNGFAAIPIIGGFSKLAKVIRAMRLLNHPAPLNLPADQGRQERDATPSRL
jgi:hypothetical protein